jgi:zinc protease
LTVLNAILGGKFTSRLNLNLRERNGFTYGVSSSFAERLGPGPFVVSTAVATDSAGAAVREILAELARIQQEPVTTAELDDTRSYLLGVFPYTLQTIQGVASRLETIAVFDLPTDHYDRLADAIAAVTREQVLSAAQAHLHPDRLSIVAVGPEHELRPRLQDLGELTASPREAEP